MSYFDNSKKKKGTGRFKPKIIGSIVGTIFFLGIAFYSIINVLTGNEMTTQGVGYNIQGDFVVIIFSLGFAGGFAYWGIANALERKKVKKERQRLKDDKKSKHKKKGGK